MKFYIRSAQDENRNFTNPVSLHEGMRVKESSDGEVLTVKSSVKKGNAWEVTFDNGDCFMYDPNEQFEVITSDTKLDKDFDVFMLMEYTADIGPDTNGMDGDEFYCLGKFYASSLEAAKKELEAIKSKYPWLKDMGSKYTARNIYVDKYNPHFDYEPEDENDIDMNPSAMGGDRYNVFADLETLIEYLGLNNSPYTEEDDEEGLPFDYEDIPEGSNFMRNCLNSALDTVELDPDYADDIATIKYSYNAPNATYDIIIYFEDGDSIKYDFDLNKLIHIDDVSEGARIISDELYAAIRSAGR